MWTKTLGNVDVILKDLHVEMLCTLIKSSFLPTNRKKNPFFKITPNDFIVSM